MTCQLLNCGQINFLKRGFPVRAVRAVPAKMAGSGYLRSRSFCRLPALDVGSSWDHRIPKSTRSLDPFLTSPLTGSASSRPNVVILSCRPPFAILSRCPTTRDKPERGRTGWRPLLPMLSRSSTVTHTCTVQGCRLRLAGSRLRMSDPIGIRSSYVIPEKYRITGSLFDHALSGQKRIRWDPFF